MGAVPQARPARRAADEADAGLRQVLRHRRGGIRGLYRLLKEHGGAVDYDLRHEWPGYRLRDLWDDDPTKLTHRELIEFVQHLPPGSATARSILGQSAAAYTTEVAALDVIAFHLAHANWQRGGGKGEKPKKPKPPIPKRF
ncbi:hypothetical protein [Streptomyces sp.]|uniref:hypothetical protein n=1 Tax=Streptomyces sp. TaxID=1931 RepID=UPI002F94763D